MTLSVFAFFYLWYGTPEIDGKWIHWNHSILPHWTESVRNEWISTSGLSYKPPNDLHSPYYPLRGPYSSRDTDTLRSQMYEMKEYEIESIIVSWWGRPEFSKGDSQGVSTDHAIANVLEIAFETNIKVALHLEPYEGRSVDSIRLDLEYITEKYSKHPAIARSKRSESDVELPIMFVYDSYHISSQDWTRLLSIKSEENTVGIRGESCDAFLVGLWLSNNDGNELSKGGFDGAYTYFATDGFSWGSTFSNWQYMAKYLYDKKMSFYPSVAPGYDDTKIRPWNSIHTRDRSNGDYYRRGWKAALNSGFASGVTITSFNEWGEGTQIEPAVVYTVDVNALEASGACLNRSSRQALKITEEYKNYGQEGPHYYLEITRENVKLLKEKRPWKFTEIELPGMSIKDSKEEL